MHKGFLDIFQKILTINLQRWYFKDCSHKGTVQIFKKISNFVEKPIFEAIEIRLKRFLYFLKTIQIYLQTDIIKDCSNTIPVRIFKQKNQ